MSSWTLWEPRLNSIAAHARLWAGDADATHPKKRSSSMTSVTGSPAGNNVLAYPCASWSVTMVLPLWSAKLSGPPPHLQLCEALQLHVDLVQIKDLRLKRAPYPFEHLLVLG